MKRKEIPFLTLNDFLSPKSFMLTSHRTKEIRIANKHKERTRIFGIVFSDV